MEWLGHARTSYHHHPTPITMSLKSTPNGPTPDPVPLPALIASVTPPCRLTPTLPNGHAQTIYAALTKEDVPLHYRRRVFPSTDPHYPGSFAVDFVLPHPTPADCARAPTHPLPPRTHPFTDAEWAASWGAPSADATPVLVALHGLSGGSYEQYLKEVLAPLVEAGWGALVVNARGCARSVVTTPRLFNARSTWDVRQVVRWLRATHPARPVFAVGFSLGANILVNYLGEEGERCEVAAAVACSNPWDLAIASVKLHDNYLGCEVYSKTMTKNLKKLFMRHVEVIKQNPDVDVERVMKATTLAEFDRAIQCPLWGYPSEGAYYRDASSTDPLLGVRVPLLGINAEDDPVAPKAALPYEEAKQNPYAVLLTTSMGGHLSWFQPGGGRWFVQPTVGFLKKMAEEVDLTQKPVVVVDGITRNPKLPAFDGVRRRLYWQE